MKEKSYLQQSNPLSSVFFFVIFRARARFFAYSYMYNEWVAGPAAGLVL